MNICVLLKPVADPDSIRWDYRAQRLDFMTPGFNPTDRYALQWACDYKEKHGACITVLTAVDAGQEANAHELLKYPIDECVVIKCKNLRQCRNETALLLAEALQGRSFGLILCGSRSEDTHSGITPVVLAELLGIPLMTDIHHIEPSSDRLWRVKRKSGRDIVQTFQIELPALIGIVGFIARRRYVPRYSSKSNLGKGSVQTIEGRIDKESDIQVLRVTEPQPNIRYFTVPSSALPAEKRLQEIMGFGQTRNADTTGKIASEISDRNIQFVKEKLLNWLKGD